MKEIVEYGVQLHDFFLPPLTFIVAATKSGGIVPVISQDSVFADRPDKSINPPENFSALVPGILSERVTVRYPKRERCWNLSPGTLIWFNRSNSLI